MPSDRPQGSRFKQVRAPWTEVGDPSERPAFTSKYPYVFVVVDHKPCWSEDRDGEPFGDDWFPSVDGEVHSIGVVVDG